MPISTAVKVPTFRTDVDLLNDPVWGDESYWLDPQELDALYLLENEDFINPCIEAISNSPLQEGEEVMHCRSCGRSYRQDSILETDGDCLCGNLLDQVIYRAENTPNLQGRS